MLFSKIAMIYFIDLHRFHFCKKDAKIVSVVTFPLFWAGPGAVGKTGLGTPDMDDDQI